MQQFIAWIITGMALAWALTSKIPGAIPKDIAEAVATAASEKPLFAGADGDKKSAALMLGISRYESGNRQVPGDCKGLPPGDLDCGNDAKLRSRGLDPEQHKPQSFCFMQVHLPNGSRTVEGWSGADLLTDPLKCARAAREIIRVSIKTSPNDEPLLRYAGGNHNAAKLRWELAQKIFKGTPTLIKCDVE
jgi:hypothetical protein